MIRRNPFHLAVVCGLVLLSLRSSVGAAAEAGGPLSTGPPPEAASLDLGEIVVTANRAPTLISRLTRHVVVLDREDIADLPAVSVPGILEYAAGVDVRQRGPGGVQADVHLRGAGFEQTTVLLNGVRMNDPQTGHHNMDLPVTVADIERIEVLQGDASSLYGPGAVGGVINIITADGAGMRQVETAAGKHGTRRLAASWPGRRGRLSLEWAGSDGYRFDTDYRTRAFFADTGPGFGGRHARLLIGYNRKDFGAESFYVPGWASREHTRTGFVNWKLQRPAHGGGYFSADIYNRRHDDRFECDTLSPNSCDNRHRARTTGLEVSRQFVAPSGRRDRILGGLVEYEGLRSSNMGRHGDARYALYLQQRVAVSRRLTIDTGVRNDTHDGYGAQWSGSLSTAYRSAPRTTLRGSVGTAFRPPSFTELYYTDPAHVSFSNLLPETAVSRELGVHYIGDRVDADLAVYTRSVRHVIDWARPVGGGGPWSIGNHGNARFSGLTAQAHFNAGAPFSWDLGYDYLDIGLEGGKEYKYTAGRPRHQARLGLHRRLSPAGSRIVIWLRYEKVRANVTLVDAAFRKRFLGGDFFLRATNIFNKRYEDVPGVPMPGFSAEAGIRWPLDAAR